MALENEDFAKIERKSEEEKKPTSGTWNWERTTQVLNIVIFIFCLIGFVYQVFEFYSYFISYPVIASYEVLKRDSFVLPAITFCNINPVQVSKYCKKYPTHCGIPSDIDKFCFDYPHYCTRNKTGHIINATQIRIPKEEYQKNDNRLTENDIMELGQNPSDIDLVGMFQGNKKSRFTRVYFVTYKQLYLCYTTNARYTNTEDPPDKKLNKDGYLTNLDTFLFDVQPAESFYKNKKRGLRFLIHSPYYTVNPFVKGISMKPGKSYRIHVRLREEGRLPYPYRTDCVDHEALWNKSGKTAPRSQQMCKNACQRAFNRECYDCEKNLTVYLATDKVCDMNEEIPCNGSKAEDKLKEELRTCKLQCKVDCRKLKYVYSHEEIPETLMEEQNLILVSMVVDEPDVIVIQHYPRYQDVELYSYIGGYMGCWLGMSICTLVNYLSQGMKQGSMEIHRKLLNVIKNTQTLADSLLLPERVSFFTFLFEIYSQVLLRNLGRLLDMAHENEKKAPNSGPWNWGSTGQVLKIVIFFICLIGFVYQVFEFYSYFTSYPVISSIEVFTRDSFVLPAITFCNINPVQVSKYCKKYPTHCGIPSDIDTFCIDYPHYCKRNKTGHITNAAQIRIPLEEYQKIDNRLTENDIMELGQNPSDFDLDPMGISQGNNKSRFTRVYFTMYKQFYLCYTTNARYTNTADPPDKKLNKDGYLTNLDTFLFDVQPAESFYKNEKHGLRFLIHSPYYTMNPFVKGISMKPGKAYRIHVSMEEEARLPYPYKTDCVDHEALWNESGKTGPRSQQMCKNACQRAFNRECYGCEKSLTVYLATDNVCDMSKEIPCNGSKAEDKLKEDLRTCKLQCKVDCRKLKYFYSHEEIPETLMEEQNLILVSMVVDEPDVVVIQQHPRYQNVEIFSYIGGYMGCWLGMSIWALVNYLSKGMKLVKQGSLEIHRKVSINNK
ncbi:hypothetical protein JTE90_015799 [Oedothorax gibbosus]|uniref:Uncharacterized protein n=1 Tax=Oedothorax gibbosus TaxID=931172 RepID=A0AAV6U9S6_9ARAC|nr:hypothetical protein JTE90_015799 [Oedothorax gibbosus]